MLSENVSETRTAVPEWCRTDVEDAISDAVARWVLRQVDAVEATPDDGDPLARIRRGLLWRSEEVVADVIAALQSVGVPFSGATGAGLEREADAPEASCRCLPGDCAGRCADEDGPGCDYCADRQPAVGMFPCPAGEGDPSLRATAEDTR